MSATRMKILKMVPLMLIRMKATVNVPHRPDVNCVLLGHIFALITNAKRALEALLHF